MKILHRIRQVSHDNEVIFKTRCQDTSEARRILTDMGCHGDAHACMQDGSYVHRAWYHKLWIVEYITEIK